MANEVLINRLYDIVSEITRIGGEQENTSITPGILVANANPGDLPTGYIKIVNPKDGTYVPCLTVNGLVVSDNDSLNVLFAKGTEPVALSQSSQSPSNSLKVSEVWESDFGAVALTADVDGNLTLNGTRTLTIPTDLIHAGDPDTLLSFTDDDAEITVGGVSLLKLTEDVQDLITLGPGSGDVDINFNGDAFLRGSDGYFGIGTAVPTELLHVRKASSGATAGGVTNFVVESNTTNHISILSPDANERGILFGEPSNALAGAIIYNNASNLDGFQFRVNGNNTHVIITSSGELGISQDLIHIGDTDTKLSFTDDDVEITVGGLSMLKLTEGAQDVITIGPGSGDVDIDFNGDAFLRGSDGRLGIGTAAPETTLHVLTSGTAGVPSTLARTAFLLQNSGAASFFSSMAIIGGNTGASIIDFGDTDDNDVGGIRYQHNGNYMQLLTNAGERVRITSAGDVGIGVTVPNQRLDIGDGGIEMEEMTAPGAGAANTARLFAQDNGAGKTQLAVQFNTGAVQVIATEP